MQPPETSRLLSVLTHIVTGFAGFLDGIEKFLGPRSVLLLDRQGDLLHVVANRHRDFFPFLEVTLLQEVKERSLLLTLFPCLLYSNGS